MARQKFSAALQAGQNGMPLAAAGNPVTVYNEDHMLVVGDYDHILHDYLKRDFAIGLKVNSVRASGYPHTWNEQLAIPENTKAVDPRVGFGTAGAPSYRPKTLNNDYKRDNWKQAFVRCYITGIRYDYFTRRMEENYGTFEDLTAKDYSDMFTDFTRKTCNDFWNGKSALDSTTSFEYSGVLSQITDVTAIADGTTISDALNTKIANAMARLDYSAMPDVIAMNPATYDVLVKEEQARKLYVRPVDAEILPGQKVTGFFTPMGVLPIVLTPFIKPEVATDGKVTHKIVALNTSMIDRIWMFDDGPKVFEIANPDTPLANDRLLTDKFVMDFSNYIVHGAQTGAHFIMTKTVAPTSAAPKP